MPPSELASIPRIYFQLEACWWFYEDFCRDANPKLPSYSLKQFAVILFDVCPTLSEWSDQAERTFLEFMRYKSRVPVCGAIMINETWDKVRSLRSALFSARGQRLTPGRASQCVLVNGWKGNSWSFPKGKINQEEPKHICAIREVRSTDRAFPSPRALTPSLRASRSWKRRATTSPRSSTPRTISKSLFRISASPYTSFPACPRTSPSRRRRARRSACVPLSCPSWSPASKSDDKGGTGYQLVQIEGPADVEQEEGRQGGQQDPVRRPLLHAHALRSVRRSFITAALNPSN